MASNSEFINDEIYCTTKKNRSFIQFFSLLYSDRKHFFHYAQISEFAMLNLFSKISLIDDIKNIFCINILQIIYLVKLVLF